MQINKFQKETPPGGLEPPTSVWDDHVSAFLADFIERLFGDMIGISFRLLFFISDLFLFQTIQ